MKKSLKAVIVHLHPGSISDEAYAAYELSGVCITSNKWGVYWVDEQCVGSFIELEQRLESLYNAICI